MAVYTEVGFAEAEALLGALGLGGLTDLQGIRSGIENTNYYATTTRGQWVLTLFERLPAEQLPYYLELMQHLSAHGVPVPAPQPDAQGRLVHSAGGKPAAVVTRLPGSHRLRPALVHVTQVGAMLAKMHLAGVDFTPQQPHLRGLDWWVETAPLVLPHLDAGQAALLRDEIAYQQHLAASPAGQALPRGPIHADLFRDNVMFDDTAGDDRLCGFFDFYFAGTDTLLFDVAVCLNDWCSDATSGALDETLAGAFMAAYGRQRPLSHGEVRALPALLRAAALRFWISRLWDWHLPRDAALLQPKDPTHFERVLRSRIANPWHPPH
ncbi:Homoserine kinase [Rubrivivax sp. A210]|uniref:homoserine kinase n=1 Tax=Rubrivivax sp. A210 TaxID=2772301 RepID=UPI001918E99C|nr:homoserine kinase [Rubrivivax sp. A210]CAD5373778.1 Homoserine kinase [Rubrivivax sp. A210]